MNQVSKADRYSVPVHIAVIMDGNGRWAKKRGLIRVLGHKVGVDSVRNIVKSANSLGIKVLTLYAFSTENWQRPQVEVKALMALLKTYLKKDLADIKINNISLRCLGQQENLPVDVEKVLQHAINQTAANDGMILNLALSYGARSEITRGVKNIIRRCASGELSVDDVSEQTINNSLYTKGELEPDLLIRTGGEKRLSNFLLWQASYAELYFTDTHWPDFREKNFINAIKDFQDRQRRYGKTAEQVT